MEWSEHQGHVLIISHDVVGERMAGPGIRYFHLARVLAQEFNTVLAVPGEFTLSADFPVIPYVSGEDERLQKAIQGARAVLIPAVYVIQIPTLKDTQVPVIVDGYDPFIAETLYLGGDIYGLQIALTQAYLLGDFFLCASERQRDWWLGLLEAHGRINSYTFGEDPSLRRLVDVVPFGLPEGMPRVTEPFIKGVWPGVGPEDKVILWGGGLWPWLDPLTAIRAIACIWRQREDIRLIFPGTRHPNPSMANIPTHAEAARELAKEFGLLDKGVFFGEWVPQSRWPNVLLESDVALSLHGDSLEARLAFRSRVLDYIWAGVPIIATRGDATSDLVEKYRLGIVVEYEDEIGVAEAILTLLERPKETWEDQFERARQDLTWERAARPLLEFCRHPQRAPDKVGMQGRLGNSYYIREISRLQSLVEGYEQGRFIRMMRCLHRVRQSLRERIK